MIKRYAIIPAAGLGKRFGGKKQFVTLNGRSLLDWTLSIFVKSDLFSKIIVCLPGDEVDRHEQNNNHAAICYIEGGANRAQSVYKGFVALKAQDEDQIFIHDAARPCLSLELLHRMIKGLEKRKAVIPILPLTDTIKEIQDGVVKKTVDREKLMRVQTPQGFTCDLLQRVYKNPPDLKSPFTDEAMMVEALGETVYTVEGEPRNIKVTTTEDVKMAEWILS